MYRARILVNGNPIPVYYDNEGNNWVEARKGSHFEIKVENKDWRRSLAIISVDGLNVIDGEHKDPWESRGYIVQGNGSIRIPGWKISQDQVREFVFTDKCTGYAAKIGTNPKNIGVIGIAIFSEKINYTLSYSSVYKDNSGNPFTGFDDQGRFTCNGSDFNSKPTDEVRVYNSTGSLAGPFKGLRVSSIEIDKSESFGFDDKVAVGSGKKSEHKTKKTDFERDDLACMLRIYYDTRENLISRGIIKESNMPEPFPSNGHWCKDI